MQPVLTAPSLTAPRRICACGILSLAIAVVASAQQAGLPGARLFSVYPVGAKQGTTVDVKVAGADLDDVSKLHFSDPAITATQKMGEPGLGQTGPQPLPGEFAVTVAAQIKPGIYEVRAIGKYGASNPRAFVVGTQSEINEKEPNNALKDATLVELGATVNGRSDAATDQDYFKFSAKKGQRVIVDCWAYRIDSRLDATLALFDSSGKQLDHNRDTNRRDALLDYTIPADGEYYVEVHDFLYNGSNEYFYRLSIGVGPHIDFVFPPAGQPGTSGQYTVYGRNLPGGQPAPKLAIDGKTLEMLNVQIALSGDQAAQDLAIDSMIEPSESGIDTTEYRLTSPQGVSNPALISIAGAPVIVEQEPNDDPAQAPLLTPPCEYVGQFYPRNDKDWVSIQARQGETYVIEVFSERLGLPTDPFLLVQQVTKDDKGALQIKDIQAVDDGIGNVGGVNYDTASDDPVFRFVAPAEGLFRIGVRDLYGAAQADPRHVYRLSIHAPQPDFRLVAVPRFAPTNPDQGQNQPTVWAPFLRKGGSEIIDVVAFRRDGFDGEIQISVDGLPAGVAAAPVTMGPTQNSAPLVLVAADSAVEAMGLIQIVGKAKIGQADVSHKARTATMIWGGQQNVVAPRSRISRNLAVAVSAGEVAPFSLTAGANNAVVEMCRAGTVQIPVAAVRRGEFKGNVALVAAGLPANVQPKNLTLDANTAAGNFDLTIQNNAPIGAYSFFLLGTSQVNYVRNPEAAQKAAERKAAIDKIAADTAAAAKAAADAKAAAEKAAIEMTAAAQKATETQKGAEKAAAEADAAAKQAAEQAKTAQAALDKDANNQGLVQAKQAADKASADAAAKAKAAVDAKAVADKAGTDATAAAKAAADAKTSADKVAAETDAKAKEVAAVQQTFTQTANDLANKAKPMPVNVGVPSTTVTLKITAAPITMAAAAPQGPLKQGAKVEIPVTITRLYNYADAVPLKINLPSGVGGVNIPAATIAAGQNQGVLVVEATKDATPGMHKLTVQAVPKFNNQDLTVSQDVTLTIEKVEPPK